MGQLTVRLVVVPSLLKGDGCLAKVVLVSRTAFHLCFVDKGRYLAVSL